MKTAIKSLMVSFVLILGTAAQAAEPTVVVEPVEDLSPEELYDLVAPIALYPDDLVALVLPASTYPLQVVAAARWRSSKSATGGAKPPAQWDDSIVALLNYPEALAKLNEDVDWTWSLGQAVLAQQGDVLAAIETFRNDAYAAGNLANDEHQTVTYEDGNILIKPADPQVIYVPYYDPVRVTHYQPVRVYHYYPNPYPVYYYSYEPYHRFYGYNYWGIGSFFGLAWSHHYIHHNHHRYHGATRLMQRPRWRPNRHHIGVRPRAISGFDRHQGRHQRLENQRRLNRGGVDRYQRLRNEDRQHRTGDRRELQRARDQRQSTRGVRQPGRESRQARADGRPRNDIRQSASAEQNSRRSDRAARMARPQRRADQSASDMRQRRGVERSARLAQRARGTEQSGVARLPRRGVEPSRRIESPAARTRQRADRTNRQARGTQPRANTDTLRRGATSARDKQKIVQRQSAPLMAPGIRQAQTDAMRAARQRQNLSPSNSRRQAPAPGVRRSPARDQRAVAPPIQALRQSRAPRVAMNRAPQQNARARSRPQEERAVRQAPRVQADRAENSGQRRGQRSEHPRQRQMDRRQRNRQR